MLFASLSVLCQFVLLEPVGQLALFLASQDLLVLLPGHQVTTPPLPLTLPPPRRPPQQPRTAVLPSWITEGCLSPSRPRAPCSAQAPRGAPSCLDDRPRKKGKSHAAAVTGVAGSWLPGSAMTCAESPP